MPVPSLQNTLNFPIQQMGRTHHSGSSGIEIVEKFYVEQYDRFQSVQRALQGRVVKNGDTWTRVAPMRDPYVRNCYCNEVQIDFADLDQTCSMPGLDSAGATNIADQLQNQHVTFQDGSAGAILTAHYRPLITAWRPGKSDNPDEDQDPLTVENAQRIWDWMDPVFTPGIMQFPWPGGLHAAVDHPRFNTRDIPVEAARPIAVPVSDLSIKRILVGEVPWGAIAQLAQVVNDKTWPVDKSPAARGLGLSFPPETLKFIDADVTNMLDAEGNRWHEIILNFKWIHETANRRFDEDGKISPGPVTWNHVFARPNGFITGWYRVFRSGTKNITLFGIPFNADFLFAGEDTSEGPIHRTGNFDNLFKLNP